jgi:uncharacterized iron-regulated protein
MPLCLKYSLLVVSLAISHFAFSQKKIEDHFKIYDTRTKQLISVEQLVQNSAGTDVIFFGEEHNDSAGHYLEDTIFKALHKQLGNDLALSLEMFETDGQTVLNEYLAGFIPEDRFSKDVRLWTNYKDYRPMIEYAKRNKIPVIAANPPRRYVNLVSRRGMSSLDSLSKDAKKFLPPLPYDTLTGHYREKFLEVMKGSPGGDNPRVYHSQSLWDAGMSYSIFKFHRKNKSKKIFHCVGKFHVDEKLGIAAQLHRRNKKLRIINISCFPDKSFNNPDWSQFIQLGDYVILTDPDLKNTY